MVRINWQYFLTVCFLVLFSFSACENPKNHHSNNDHTIMNTRDSLIFEIFQRFGETNDPEVIKEAYRLITAATADEDADNLSSSWLTFFEGLSKYLDSDWDPENFPKTNLIPESSGDISYPSGIDPSEIQDSIVRKEYEARLEQNKIKAKTYSVQQQLHRIGDLALTDFENWVKRIDSQHSELVNDLQEAFNRSTISPDLKPQLNNILNDR